MRLAVKLIHLHAVTQYVLEDGSVLRQYEILTAEQLRSALRTRGIPGIGTKKKMISALKDDDIKPGCTEYILEGYTYMENTYVVKNQGIRPSV